MSKRYFSIYVIMAIILSVCIFAGCDPRVASNGPEHEDEVGNGITEQTVDGQFHAYNGPILTLKADNVVAERSLAYSFSYDEAVVTDSYTITSKLDQSVQMVYPVLSSLEEIGSQPVMFTVDGQQINCEMHLSSSLSGFSEDGMNIGQVSTYDEIAPILDAFDYETDSLSAEIDGNQIVTVYTISDINSLLDEHATTLAFETQVEGNQQIMTMGFNGGSMDESGYRRCSFFVSEDGLDKYIIVFGGPLEEYQLQGYKNGACEETVEGVTATVRMDEMTLEEALVKVVALYNKQRSKWDQEAVDTSHLDGYKVSILKELLNHTSVGLEPMGRYTFMELSEILMDAMVMDRIVYYTYDQLVSADIPLQLDIQYTKSGSHNYNNTDPIMYDVAFNYSGDINLQSFTVNCSVSGIDQLESNTTEFLLEDSVYTGLVDVESGYVDILVK